MSPEFVRLHVPGIRPELFSERIRAASYCAMKPAFVSSSSTTAASVFPSSATTPRGTVIVFVKTSQTGCLSSREARSLNAVSPTNTAGHTESSEASLSRRPCLLRFQVLFILPPGSSRLAMLSARVGRRPRKVAGTERNSSIA